MAKTNEVFAYCSYHRKLAHPAVLRHAVGWKLSLKDTSLAHRKTQGVRHFAFSEASSAQFAVLRSTPLGASLLTAVGKVAILYIWVGHLPRIIVFAPQLLRFPPAASKDYEFYIIKGRRDPRSFLLFILCFIYQELIYQELERGFRADGLGKQSAANVPQAIATSPAHGNQNIKTKEPAKSWRNTLAPMFARPSPCSFKFTVLGSSVRGLCRLFESFAVLFFIPSVFEPVIFGSCSGCEVYAFGLISSFLV